MKFSSVKIIENVKSLGDSIKSVKFPWWPLQEIEEAIPDRLNQGLIREKKILPRFP